MSNLTWLRGRLLHYASDILARKMLTAPGKCEVEGLDAAFLRCELRLRVRTWFHAEAKLLTLDEDEEEALMDGLYEDCGFEQADDGMFRPREEYGRALFEARAAVEHLYDQLFTFVTKANPRLDKHMDEARAGDNIYRMQDGNAPLQRARA